MFKYRAIHNQFWPRYGSTLHCWLSSFPLHNNLTSCAPSLRKTRSSFSWLQASVCSFSHHEVSWKIPISWSSLFPRAKWRSPHVCVRSLCSWPVCFHGGVVFELRSWVSEWETGTLAFFWWSLDQDCRSSLEFSGGILHMTHCVISCRATPLSLPETLNNSTFSSDLYLCQYYCFSSNKVDEEILFNQC